MAKREDRAQGRIHPGHRGLTQPPRTELKLSLFYLFISPSPFPTHNLHPAPSPRPLDMRTSACLLFQLDGGQNVGKGQRRRSKGGCRADCARQQKLPRKPGSRRDLGRDRHSHWGQQGARAPGRWEGRGPGGLQSIGPDFGQPTVSSLAAPC